MHTEILREIREAEAEAIQIDKTAQEKHREAIAKAHEDASGMMQDACGSAEKKGRRLIQEKTTEAEAQAVKITEDGARRVDEIRSAAQGKTDDAIERVVKVLMT